MFLQRKADLVRDNQAAIRIIADKCLGTLQVHYARVRRNAETGRYELLPSEVRLLASQADYCQQVLLSVSCYTMTQVAKEMSMTVYDLTRRLLQCGIIYYQSNQYMLYADFARKGYAKTRTDWRKCRDGKNRSTVRLVWTESGRQFLHDFCEEEKTRDEQLGLIEFC